VAAYSRILARDLAGRPDGSKVLVNVCCPGYVNTDMSSHRGKPPDPSQGRVGSGLQVCTQKLSVVLRMLLLISFATARVSVTVADLPPKHPQ
jgi:NAD(P)-dependent dehydrogenase (short-subunit alcohol dehydrogenase family)